MLKKVHFQFDKKDKNSSFKKKLLKKYKNYTASRSDVIVVLGGDGFMLNTIKKLKKAKLLRVPKLSEIPYPVVMEPSLVIEYYSR